jgi:hypothetical protein
MNEDFIASCVLTILIIVVVFESMRRMTLYGVKRKYVLVFLAAALAGLSMGGMFFWRHQKTSDLIATAQESPFIYSPEEYISGKPPERSVEISRGYASAAYLGQGLLLRHLDPSDKWVLFQPNQKQIEMREQRVASLAVIANQSIIFLSLAWVYWLGCLIATIFGWYVGRYRPDPSGSVK